MRKLLKWSKTPKKVYSAWSCSWDGSSGLDGKPTYYINEYHYGYEAHIERPGAMMSWRLTADGTETVNDPDGAVFASKTAAQTACEKNLLTYLSAGELIALDMAAKENPKKLIKWGEMLYADHSRRTRVQRGTTKLKSVEYKIYKYSTLKGFDATVTVRTRDTGMTSGVGNNIPTLVAAQSMCEEDLRSRLTVGELIALDEAKENPKNRYGKAPPPGRAEHELRQAGYEPLRALVAVATPHGPVLQVETAKGTLWIGTLLGTDRIEIRRKP